MVALMMPIRFLSAAGREGGSIGSVAKRKVSEPWPRPQIPTRDYRVSASRSLAFGSEDNLPLATDHPQPIDIGRRQEEPAWK